MKENLLRFSSLVIFYLSIPFIPYLNVQLGPNMAVLSHFATKVVDVTKFLGQKTARIEQVLSYVSSLFPWSFVYVNNHQNCTPKTTVTLKPKGESNNV